MEYHQGEKQDGFIVLVYLQFLTLFWLWLVLVILSVEVVKQNEVHYKVEKHNNSSPFRDIAARDKCLDGVC